MSNPNYDAILSSTFEKYAKTFADNVFDKRPLLIWLNKHKQPIDGGAAIVEPIMYGDNSTVGVFSAYDNVPTTPQEGLSAANYPIQAVAATTAISTHEEVKNAGESKIISLLETKVKQTEEALRTFLNEHFFSNSAGAKDWQNIDDIVAVDSEIGGIDSNTGGNEYWDAYVDAASPDEALTLQDIDTAVNTVHIGDPPDFHITTQDLYEKFHALVQPALRYEDVESANAGFKTLTYKGAEVAFDRDAPAKTWYVLNSMHLFLRPISGEWFTATPFEKPHGQLARYNQVYAFGNLVTNNRQRLGKLTGRIA